MLNSFAFSVGLLGFIAMLAIAFARIKKAKERQPKKQVKPFANTIDIRNLPEYRSAKKKYHLMIGLLSIIFIATVVTTTVLIARPVSVTIAKPSYENRDIMFCVDYNGIANNYTKDMLVYFSEIMNNLQGQRIGMTLFGDTYIMLSPLSDDYVALSDLLLDIKESPETYSSFIHVPHTGDQMGESEVGASLVGCVNGFDKLNEEERSRTIILITENKSPENPVVSLAEATSYAKQKGISVYGINFTDSDKDFREAMLATGGAYYVFNDASDDAYMAKEISDNILAQEAARFEGTDTLIYKDTPLTATLILAICLTLFFIAVWRLGL